MNSILKPYALAICLVLMGCVSAQQRQQQAQVEQIRAEFINCVKSSTKYNASKCAYALNQNIKRTSDTDPGKPAALIYSTKLYVLLSKFERKQISEEDVKIGLMNADAELARDTQVLARQSANESRQQSIYQQQMFNNAAQLLRGDGGGQVNCYSTPGVPSGFYCR